MSDTATETTEKPDYEANLVEVFTAAAKAFADGKLPEESATAVAEAFRAIPSAARSKAQGTALKAVLTTNPDAVEPILDICNNLPKATTSRSTKPAMSPVEAGTLQAAALLVAYAEVVGDEENGEAIAAAANELYSNGLAEDDKRREPILKLATAALKATTRKGGGGGGARKSFTETLEDLIKRGDLATGTVLTGPGDAKARINKDGKIQVGTGSDAQVFENFSGAARHVKGEGKSVNGWDFWSVEKDGESVTVGSLRQA